MTTYVYSRILNTTYLLSHSKLYLALHVQQESYTAYLHCFFWLLFLIFRPEQRWPSLASSATENRLQGLHDHIQVLASDCSDVPSRLVRASLNHRQSALPAFSCSWWLTSPGDQNYYFRACSFASNDPKLWNSLPLPLRDSTLTLRQFSSRLKTHLFSLAYGRASWLLRL